MIGSPSRTIDETPFAASTNGVVVTNNIPSWQNILISNVTASTMKTRLVRYWFTP